MENFVTDVLSLALCVVVKATEDSQLVHDTVITILTLLEHAVVRPEVSTKVAVWHVLQRQSAAAPVG